MTDYKVIDCGDFKKLEQVGPYRLVRPSPQAVWAPTLSSDQWECWDAQYIRTSEGKGYWKDQTQLKESWMVQAGGLNLNMKQTSFGHLGAFFEQAPNWQEFKTVVEAGVASRSNYRVLNLFAYTGGASLACASGGAEVVHLDASKSSNLWAKENADLNGMGEAPIRWITDDTISFVEREIRRQNTYHGIILDPPSFGRGAKGQVWKVESDMVPLLQQLKKIMAPDFHFISLSSHSPGYTPITLKNLISQILDSREFEYKANEMTIPYSQGDLPAGATCIATQNK